MTRYTRGLPADVLAYMRTVGDGGTTVAQVADHFGITSQQAAGILKKLTNGGDLYYWRPYKSRVRAWAVKTRTGAGA